MATLNGEAVLFGGNDGAESGRHMAVEWLPVDPPCP